MNATVEDIKAALRSYRCQYAQDEEGNGFELVDMLTPMDDQTIERGLLEIELLAEHILYELLAEEE